MKLRLPRRRYQKKDDAVLSLKVSESTTSSDAPEDRTETETETETEVDELISKDILVRKSSTVSNTNGWDLQQNKLAVTVEERWRSYHVQKVVELWDLTEEERSKLLVLKEKIEDIDHWKNDPYEAVRFLKEKRGSISKAEALFRETIQWRLDHDIDNMLETYPMSPLFNYFPIATLKGVDYDGDPIHLERPGAADCWSFYQRLGPDEIYDMSIFMREMDTRGPWQQQYEQEQGHPMKHFTILLDLQGLNQNHMRAGLMPLLGKILHMAQYYYPFFAKRIIIMRAPRIFKLLWSIAQHFVHESIKKLIVFTTQQDYLEVLDRYMDRAVLPSCICPEGRGEGALGFEKIRFEGGQLPPSSMSDAEIDALLDALREQDREARSSGEDDVSVEEALEEKELTSNKEIQVNAKPIAKGFLSPSKKQRPAAKSEVVCC